MAGANSAANTMSLSGTRRPLRLFHGYITALHHSLRGLHKIVTPASSEGPTRNCRSDPEIRRVIARSGATKQSRSAERDGTRLLRGACPRAARGADPWARNDGASEKFHAGRVRPMIN